MPPDFRTRRRERVDADDVLIKIFVALLLVLAGWRVSHWYRHSTAAALAAQTQTAQAGSAETALRQSHDIARRAEQEARQQQASASGAASVAGQTIYKCETSQGTQLQSLPCAPGASITWTRSAGRDVQAKGEWRRQAELRQHEAEIARYTRMYGDNANRGHVSPYPQSGALQQRRFRCQAAKDDREAVLKIAGLNRNFDLIRQLNDAVYEACNDT